MKFRTFLIVAGLLVLPMGFGPVAYAQDPTPADPVAAPADPAPAADVAVPDAPVAPEAAADVPADALEGDVPAEEGATITTPADGDVAAAWGMIDILVKAFKDKDYLPFTAGLLMLLVWIFNTVVKNRIPKKQIAWWAAGVATLGAIAVNMATIPANGVWWQELLKAIGMGLTIGPAASGMWSLVGKKVFPTAVTEPPKE